ERYDLIVDMISNHSISDNLKVLKKQGRMVIVGGGKGNWIGPLMPSIKAVIMNNFVDQELQQFVAQFNSKDLESLAELMRQGQLSSVIDRRYSLDEIQDAISYSESGRAKGKIIVTISK
ncbi:MAG: zinc-binding dehydrogenase, partial [SAR86 cluster bacterium]|nr:zinc-binding dehydrogenase [SAR86 cluster bacterium]